MSGNTAVSAACVDKRVRHRNSGDAADQHGGASIELLPAKGTSAASACRYLTLINLAVVLLSWEPDINFTKPKMQAKNRRDKHVLSCRI